MVGDHRPALSVGLLEFTLCLNALEFMVCLRAKGIVRGEHGGHFPEPRRLLEPIESLVGTGQLGGNQRFLAGAQRLTGKKRLPHVARISGLLRFFPLGFPFRRFGRQTEREALIQQWCYG
jgi:hypothetical protein